MRPAVFLAVAGLLLLSACRGGSGDATPTAGHTPVPTATAFATVPQPTIVTSTATPPPAAAATSPASGGEATYVVVAGDALSLIAERFGVPSAEIAKLNNLEGTNIFIGQRLRIPRPAASGGGGGTTPAGTPTPSSGVTTYTVKPGDTGFGIALQFDVTLEALEQANGVKAGGLNSLQAGQVLKLPRPGQP